MPANLRILANGRFLQHQQGKTAFRVRGILHLSLIGFALIRWIRVAAG